MFKFGSCTHGQHNKEACKQKLPEIETAQVITFPDKREIWRENLYLFTGTWAHDGILGV